MPKRKKAQKKTKRPMVSGIIGAKAHINAIKESRKGIYNLVQRTAGMSKVLPKLKKQPKTSLPRQKRKRMQLLANIASNLSNPGGINATKPPNRRVISSYARKTGTPPTSGLGFIPPPAELNPIIVN